jgi:hypothetical protein
MGPVSGQCGWDGGLRRALLAGADRSFPGRRAERAFSQSVVTNPWAQGRPVTGQTWTARTEGQSPLSQADRDQHGPRGRALFPRQTRTSTDRGPEPSFLGFTKVCHHLRVQMTFIEFYCKDFFIPSVIPYPTATRGACTKESACRVQEPMFSSPGGAPMNQVDDDACATSNTAPTQKTVRTVGGTSTIIRYQMTTKHDGTNQCFYQAITAMSPYRDKSFEELRLDDYLVGNNGMQCEDNKDTQLQRKSEKMAAPKNEEKEKD